MNYSLRIVALLSLSAFEKASVVNPVFDLEAKRLIYRHVGIKGKQQGVFWNVPERICGGDSSVLFLNVVSNPISPPLSLSDKMSVKMVLRFSGNLLYTPGLQCANSRQIKLTQHRTPNFFTHHHWRQEFSFCVIIPRGQILNLQSIPKLFTIWLWAGVRLLTLHSCSYIRRSLSLIHSTACYAGLLFQSIEPSGRTSYPIFLSGQSLKVNITIQWGHFWTLE